MKKLPKWSYPLLAIVAIALGWEITHKAKLAMTVETDLFSQGQVELNRGNLRSSIEIFDTFLRRDPNHVPALQFKLQAEMKLDDWKAAEETADRIMRLQPTPPNKAQLAEIYRHNGKMDLANQLLNLPAATPSPSVLPSPNSK